MPENDSRPLGGNIPEYSVSELSFALKRTVEDAYSQVRVRGELSGFKRHASGHCYFSLKDERACMDAVLWRAKAGGLGFQPEDGLEVVASGKLSTYPDRSKYQIVVERLEPAGIGALLAQLERLKARLFEEGLFAPARKRPIPFLPQVIGVITSPTGAVIRDILHRLEDRFPRCVLVWPVAVQGEGAASDVAAAIHGFNAPSGAFPRPDVLIIARGGGSIEDLWGFNDELVVRAVVGSAIPVISAVGHETDTTLCDLAADLRAPTPTAAAEMAVPVRTDLVANLSGLAARLERQMSSTRVWAEERLSGFTRQLPRIQSLLGLPQQRLDDLGARLPRGLDRAGERNAARLDSVSRALRPEILEQRARLAERDAGELRLALRRSVIDRLGRRTAALERWTAGLRPVVLLNRSAAAASALMRERRLLANLSPLATLARGYAVVENSEGRVLTTATAARDVRRLAIRFVDGRVEADVRRTKLSKVQPPQQGELL